MDTFAIILEQNRTRVRATQAELARAAGISASYINRMEKGDRPPPSRDVVLRIAESLHLDGGETDELLLSAGYAPLASAVLPVEHPVLELMADILRDGYVPDEELDLLKRQVELIRRRWYPKNGGQ